MHTNYKLIEKIPLPLANELFYVGNEYQWLLLKQNQEPDNTCVLTEVGNTTYGMFFFFGGGGVGERVSVA